MNLVKQFGEYNLTTKKNREIKYIVIHYTAGTKSKAGTALSTAKYFNKETTKASADFIVDDETVVQFNPDIANKYTWHCGGSKYKTQGGSLYKICTSANSIGIEVCSTNDTGKITNANDEHWSFTDAVVKNTIELTKQLMKDYNVSADNVIRHYDVNGKPCPGIIGWNIDTGDDSKWNAFKCELMPVDMVKVEEAVQDNTEVEEKVLTVGDVIQAIEEPDLTPVYQEPEVEADSLTVTIGGKPIEEKKGLLQTIIDLIKSLIK